MLLGPFFSRIFNLYLCSVLKAKNQFAILLNPNYCNIVTIVNIVQNLKDVNSGFVNANLITRDSRILTTPVILPRPPF